VTGEAGAIAVKLSGFTEDDAHLFGGCAAE
jgi:hypothetical protein